MKLDKFKTYLIKSGAEILEPTNPYEAVRFRTINGVSVIYCGKRGYSFTGEALEAYEKMKSKGVWVITSRGLKEKQDALKKVRSRDGDNCFFCNMETSDENRTLEHILSVDNGGNNSPENLAIACKSCNTAVGSMPIVEKIKYRDTVRGLK